MAIFKKNSGPGENFSGKVGNVIYRQCGDKVVIVAAPSDYTTSQSEASVADRQCFRLVNSSVPGINQIHIFRTIWKSSSVPGRAIGNKIIHINKPRIAINPSYSSMMLIPAEDYFPVELDSFNSTYIDHHMIYDIVIKPLNNAGLTMDDIETISLQGLLCCSEPNESGRKDFSFLPFLPSMRPLDLNSSLEFSLKHCGGNMIEAEKYNKKSMLLNLITYNTNFEPYEASENILIELE